MELMTPRQLTILNGVVEIHIATALPVGSQLLRERYGLDYSSATLRSEMGLLGEKGYLTQPHTSSGRLPTDLGYRFYVNELMTRGSRIPRELLGRIHSDLMDCSRAFDEPEPFIEEASRLLAHFAREASLVFMLNPQRETMGRQERIRVYLQGSSHILEKPEFQDVNKVRPLFRAFEEKIKLAEWLAFSTAPKAVSIRIGQENEPEAFHDCSVIATQYFSGGEKAGTIAILGPKRMQYIYTIPLVVSMAEFIGRFFEERYSSQYGEG